MNNSIGTIIDLPRGGAVIMVSDCNFVMIRRKKGMFLGQQVCFTDYDIKETNNVKAKLAATIFSIAAVFVIAIAAYLQLVVNSPANNTYAFVGIDINPSMEFLVGKDNLVIGVKPVNDDARSLIKDFKPERKQIGEVIYSIEKIAGQKGYIKPGSNNIMLVSVSLNPDMEMSIDKEFEFEKLIEEIEYAISTLDNSNVEGKLVEVPMGLKKKADKNGITVGRQYIYEKSIEQNINLSLEEIKKEEIANLLEEVKIVYNNSNDELHEIPVPTQTSIMTPLPSPTVTATPVAYTSTPTAVTETKLTPTKKAELLPTAVPQKTQNQTVKQTPITSEVKTDNDYAVISGKAEGGRIVLNWQQPERKKGFQYYKVVASKNNVRPKYPQDGYLYAISDFGTTSAVIDNNQPYNDGDFGAKFSNGQKYYFSI
ncbi:MAG: anti-sigma factor domain-containing protein, partial [Clostridiaceae bacterium]|nr:anti-sigma factor domain-containing protein [Clostridiaceae bacterium]